ncbi:signal recognition particle receptor subunit beta [Maylandia zebra]|uniref:Signal recognition particle receptor subunit beta n=3 Tax=Haplochromini TaxID=319058 RepID=A0A3B4FDG0_9CICH|nr:signal recognition particle receptor subunit beta [Maylandia zebra]XP_005742156.1 PREDICTED: signal recognition particle receptor subunit beta [Pundamilia nyererei]XP_005930016.1 signal recognition particle receptor subunit beta [Haplochromis burtoni]XP_026047311.1 signal recognition particle receptor subunit beta [Astatotilapia calliptera]XP_039865304.1 signal recognition particle receptor subunit beta [Simochromis diagramma]
MEAHSTGGNVGEKADVEMAGSPFEPYIESLRQQLEEQDPVFLIGVIVALAVVVITCVFLKYFLTSKTVRTSVLLVGLCDSGKTLLFSRLLSGKFKRTQTSITDSSAPYKAKNDRGSTWTLIDLPGHDSLRPQYLEKFKSAARAIVFVVDSAIFQKEVRDVAEFLYVLLTDAVITRNAPALVVACNKQDITMAKSAKLIQQQLEKELNTLRVTRSAALSSQDGSVGGSMYLGKKGKDFEFSQLPMKVEFVECSARGSKGEDGGDADMELLEKALAKL